MNAVRFKTRSRSASRRGLIAISEMLVMVVALVGLFWLGSQLIASVANVPTAKANSCSDRRVYRILAEKDGQRLWVYRPNDGIVRIELATKEIDLTLPLSGIEVTAVSHSTDGSTTLLCGLNGAVMLFHGNQEAKTTRIQKRDDFVLEAAVSENGSTAVAVTMAGQVLGWRQSSAEPEEFSYSLEDHSHIVRCSLNAAGTKLSVARNSGEVTVHEPTTGVKVGEPLRADDEWRQGAECIGFTTSDDEQFLGVVTSLGKIRVYNLASHEVVFQSAYAKNTSAARVTAFAISGDAKQIAMATNTASEIQLWNLETGEHNQHLSGHAGIVRSIQFSPVMNRLYSGSYDGTVREWSLDSLTQLRIID
ncbi:MAG: repeat-like protein [Schlesneria sp.]|nr:repeat-like protein [Schlesneria sp.]